LVVYVLIAIAVAVIGYLLFFRKGGAKDLPGEQPREVRGADKKSVAPTRKASEHPASEDVDVSTDDGTSTSARPSAPPSKPPRPPSRRPSQPDTTPEAPSARKGPSAEEVQSLRKGLAKSRASEGIVGRLISLITGKKELDEGIAAEIEEVLLTSDVGVKTTQSILDRIKDGLRKGELTDSDKVWAALREEAVRILSVGGKTGGISSAQTPTIVLLVGVNGAGKTTTIGKLATKLNAGGKKIMLAAGDTFRAAAVEQLKIWGERVGCEVVSGKDGADPGSVVFDAAKRATENGTNIVLCDTAGRLHTKTNLMNEMTKIAKTAGKAVDGAPHEILLVIDATNGQNAMAQAKEFQAALPLTGIVLTKLDGTAKGGVILGICDELGLPVRFVGLGERPDDLHEFSPEAFVEALLGKDAEADAA
jgi:fused signal recognition particle receptor